MRFSTLLILVPVAAIAVILALANREVVNFRLLPFTDEPATILAMPLFLLVFLSFFLGVLLGGAVVAWRRIGRKKPPVKEPVPAIAAGSETKS